MKFEQKCAILEEVSRYFTLDELDRDFFADFIIYNDLGLPLAQIITYEFGTLNKQGMSIVEETWRNLCELLNVDPFLDYEDLDEMLDEQEDE